MLKHPIKSYCKSALLATKSLLILSCAADPTDDVKVELPDHAGVLSEHQKQLIVSTIKLYPDQTQFAFSIVRGGEIQYYGVKRENGIVKEVENFNKAFEIGSISKTFTGTLLADFTYNKKINIEDPINSYYNFPFKSNVQLSFKSLSNHTSGLPRLPSNMGLYARTLSDNPYKNYGGISLESYLKAELSLDSEPGTIVAYSNLGAGLLGYTLSKASDKSYEQLLQDKIFVPYNMPNSTTQRDLLNIDLVQGLGAKGKKVSNWDFDALAGAGAIFSTAEDLSQMALAHFNEDDAVLSLSRSKSTELVQQMPFGKITPALGWFFVETNSGNNFVWHNGGTGGYRSEMAIDVENKNALIILSNVSGFHKHGAEMDNLAFNLMSTFTQ